MGTKLIIGVGLLLVGILAVVALQWQPATPSESAMPSSSPTTPSPSRGNVSAHLKEKTRHLKEVVAQSPHDSRTAFELARLLQDGHDLQGAIQYYELGLKSDARDVDARIDYSLCLYQTGREEDALLQTRIVLERDGGNARALFNAGAIHANRGADDSARYYWDRLVVAHPRDELAVTARKNLEQLNQNKHPM